MERDEGEYDSGRTESQAVDSVLLRGRGGAADPAPPAEDFAAAPERRPLDHAATGLTWASEVPASPMPLPAPAFTAAARVVEAVVRQSDDNVTVRLFRARAMLWGGRVSSDADESAILILANQPGSDAEFDAALARAHRNAAGQLIFTPPEAESVEAAADTGNLTAAESPPATVTAAPPPRDSARQWWRVVAAFGVVALVAAVAYGLARRSARA